MTTQRLCVCVSVCVESFCEVLLMIEIESITAVTFLYLYSLY